MNKKWGLFLGAVLLSILIWYFFLKPHDYVVGFEVKALPGTINQTVKSWGNQLDDAQFVGQKDLSDLKYRIQFSDTVYIYHWKIESLNDSVSQVKVYVTDTDHSLANRLDLPFWNTDFEKRTKKTAKDFLKKLQNHLENFKVTVTGKEKTPSKYCACVALKGTQREKAIGMMENYSFLSGFMAEKDIGLDGSPMVEVVDWNMKNDSIFYNFCFPVIKSDSLPRKGEIFYKQIERRPAIRAVYNGNYITSDRAWYALIDYAENHNIATDKKPLEVFHSNPNIGGNELEWEAEIYLPVRE